MNRELRGMGSSDVKIFDVWTLVIKDTSAFLTVATKSSNCFGRNTFIRMLTKY